MKPIYPELYYLATATVKKRVARWPSAYASGQVVQEYEKLVKKHHGHLAKAFVGKKTSKAPLSHWFDERWIDILTGLPCGSVKSQTYYPVCRPAYVVDRLTPGQILDAVQRKQKVKTKTASYPPYFRK